MCVGSLLVAQSLAGERPLEGTIIGEFATRREAELAVDHLVQECGVPRSDVFVQPVGRANSARTHAAAADVKVAPWQEGQQKLDGALEASWISTATIQKGR